MKSILILLSLVGLMACQRTANVSDPVSVGRWEGGTITVRVIDGCEYIRVIQEYTHKGDCTNPIHCYNTVK